MILISGPEIARYGFPQGHPFGYGSPRRVHGAARAIARRRESRPAAGAAGDARGARVLPHAGVRRSRHRAVGARQRLARRRRHAGVPRRLRSRGERRRRHARGAGRDRRGARAPRVHSDRRAASRGARRRGGLLRLQRLRRRDRGGAQALRHSPRRVRRHRRASRRRRVLRVRAGSRRRCSRICTRTAAISIPAPGAAARRAAAPPPARSSTSRCRRAPTTRCSSRRGRKSSAISRTPSPS